MEIYYYFSKFCMIIIRIIKIYKATQGCGSRRISGQLPDNSRTIPGLTYRELNIEAI